MYLTALFTHVVISATPAPHRFAKTGFEDLSFLGKIRASFEADGVEKDERERNELDMKPRTRRFPKLHRACTIFYFLFILAQTGLCVLEIARLDLANLGIGLLPFTFVTLMTAAAVRYTKGLGSRSFGWRLTNLGAWIALAVTNSVKVAEEAKEGTGARKGSGYPMSEQLAEVSVMVGVYTILALLEIEGCLTVL